MKSLIEDDALARIIELRQHNKFVELVGNILENGNWVGLLDQIKRIEEKPEAVQGWEMPLRTGVIRDAMIDVLGLQRLNGLDGNLLEIFNKLDADNLEDLRLHAETHAHQLLETQIRKGNTFFLEIDDLKDNSSAHLIPDIIKVRQKQLESMNTDTSFGEIYSTYYGFAILTQGSIVKDSGGASFDALQELESLLVITPEVVKRRKQIRYSPSLFGRVTVYTKKLLWSLLCITIGGGQHQVSGADELGKLGDSRAVGLLKLRLQRTKTQYLAKAMIGALSSIGSPECFEPVNFWCERGKWHSGIELLGNIRHPAVFEIIMDRFSRYGRRDLPDTILKMMGNTRNLRFVQVLVDIINDKRYGKSRIEALRALKMLGAIDEARERIDSILVEKYHIIEVLELLSGFPEIEWSKERIAIVASALKDWKFEKVKGVIEKISALMESDDIQQVLRDAIHSS